MKLTLTIKAIKRLIKRQQKSTMESQRIDIDLFFYFDFVAMEKEHWSSRYGTPSFDGTCDKEQKL